MLLLVPSFVPLFVTIALVASLFVYQQGDTLVIHLDSPLGLLAVCLLLTAPIMTIGMMALCMIAITARQSYSTTRKAFSIVILVYTGSLALPIYWYRFIWRDATSDSVTHGRAGMPHHAR